MNSRSKKKARYKADKKRRFYRNLRKHAHNLLSLLIILDLFVFAYLLFYGLIFEPIFISKTYGPSDTQEFFLMAIMGLFIGVFYLIRYWINYTEEQQWQRNWRLLRDVNFNLDRYNSLKRMGIDHIRKKKKKRRHTSASGSDKKQ